MPCRRATPAGRSALSAPTSPRRRATITESRTSSPATVDPAGIAAYVFVTSPPLGQERRMGQGKERMRASGERSAPMTLTISSTGSSRTPAVGLLAGRSPRGSRPAGTRELEDVWEEMVTRHPMATDEEDLVLSDRDEDAAEVLRWLRWRAVRPLPPSDLDGRGCRILPRHPQHAAGRHGGRVSGPARSCGDHRRRGPGPDERACTTDSPSNRIRTGSGADPRHTRSLCAAGL